MLFSDQGKKAGRKVMEEKYPLSQFSISWTSVLPFSLATSDTRGSRGEIAKGGGERRTRKIRL